MKKITLNKALILLILLLSASSFAQDKTYFVAPYGNDENHDGSFEKPFRTITKASEEAIYEGDKVFIREGVYREGGISHTGEGSESKPIIFQNYENESVIIKGSDIYKNFSKVNENIWVVDGVDFNAQQVFCNGEMLRKVGYPNRCLDPSTEGDENSCLIEPWIYNPITMCEEELFGMCEGTFYYHEEGQKFFVWLPNGLDPNEQVIEISNKRWIWRNIQGKYVTLRGLNFMHTNLFGSFQANTNPPLPISIGAAVTLGLGGVVENCTFSYCDAGGLHFNNLNELAETNQIVRNSKFHHNGITGLSASFAGGFLVEDNVFYENSYRPFNANWASAAMKFIPNAWGEIRNNTIRNEYGQGIWFDHCTTDNEKLVHNNYIENVGIALTVPFLIDGEENGHGIFIEVTGNATIYNNIIINAYHRGIYLSTSWDGKVAHNLITNTQHRGQIGLTYKIRPGGYTLHDNEIYNNILYNKNGSIDIEIISGGDEFDPSSNNVLDNNLIYNENGTGYSYKHLAYPEVDYNNLSDWYEATGHDKYSIQGENPEFNFNGESQPDNTGYWSLSPFGSPAIDKGKWLSFITNDYINTPRPQGKYDIGPYEHINNNGRMAQANSNSDLLLFPNPSNGYINLKYQNIKEISNLNIININGKVVKTFTDGFDKELDISEIPSGIYFVKIDIYKEQPLHKKLIVN